KFLSWVDEVALAIWFLDNGSISRSTGGKPSAYLHTQRFDKHTNERFVELLKSRFGIGASVAYDKRDYYFLRFGQEATACLFDMIRPFPPECMAYKVDGTAKFKPPFVPASEITVAPVRSVETIRGRSRSRPYVFDLEVADHHNYIAGNV